MFERTLQDLIRGLRAHKASSKAQEDAFLLEAMGEIREELKGKDMALKAEGIIKTCYLMMLYPITPPSGFAFHVVEVMSSPRYHLKQLGYFAAPMAFSGETEEVVLTVNGIKKDLMSPHLPLPPLPLTALPHLLSLSPSLSHTLHPDLLHLLTHSSPRIRKRAVLCLLPCWEAFPEGLREGFPRLRERLADDDQGVVGACVSVVMELARRQGGKNYLPLAPELFGILTGSSNNWILIKVVKLFAILTPLEPRLVRKLLPPITNLISSTSAISLLYECVRTCIVGGMLDPDRPESDALARVCVEKLGGYLRGEGGDQNLRYISLLAMVKITPTHPHMVAEYQEEILQSLDDPDVSIRMRALELVTAMVDRDNLQSISDQLLSHLSPTSPDPLPSALASLQALSSSAPRETASALSLTPAYRLLLTQRLLSIVSANTYANVTDFEWVISLLVDISYVSQVDVGRIVKEMLEDVVGRVRSVREFAVGVLEKVLADEEVRERARDGSSEEEAGVVQAAVWICGEHSSFLSSPLSTITALLPSSLAHSSPHLIALSLHATLKILGTYLATSSSRWSADQHAQTRDLVSSVQAGIAPFLGHGDIEVQERAAELDVFLKIIAADLGSHKPPISANATAISTDIPGLEVGFGSSTGTGPAGAGDQPNYPKSLFLLQPLFTAHELNAVGSSAQAAVPIPEGLDLDRDIVPGGGWVGVDDDDMLELESEGEKEEVDLGQGGGEGMDELRRVIREGGKKGRGKGKGKGKKTEDGVMESKEERDRRRRERRERHKDDPYYLAEKDDGSDELDIDDIPIVRLELDDPDPTSAVQASKSGRSKSSKTKAKIKAKAPPPDFDRMGEMPEGVPASAIPTAKGANGAEKEKKGLAGVDLLGAESEPTRRGGGAGAGAGMSGRFEEYDLDREDIAIRGKDEAEKTGSGDDGDVPAESGDIQVIKVKRKKKKRVEGE
ncbi:putative delta adaptin-like subunit of the clathrin associated protein complex [Dioszegia hungarica]|uniref:AP-3 complex subunit delta n=1 Tax=Dioszegia hungarica TaxID=4972 RepID=A0AA38H5K5_9TREE|nr:putative delta adaptin-like subunit of the clathrin associated protein complex [Dioszegia hungarica]KAI9632944.1 putative delta adaptin-like subunit of the clathrin associated protein complex [Dioszegia hungarica]